MKKIYLAFIIIAVILVAAGGWWFWQGQQQPQQRKITVVTSFYPLYFFAQQIAGDKAAVINITPAGAEPHDYEPTARDLANIEGSQMLVISGNGLEPWAGNELKNLEGANVLAVTAGEGLGTRQLTEDGQTATDPHVWLAPELAKNMVDKIAQGFEQIDPANSQYYQLSSTALKLKLDILDATYKQGLANCQQKDIVTSHAAFGYLAQAYGLNQVAISGLSPDAEPSPQQLIDIAQMVKQNHIGYIFFESLVSPKLSQTIASETGAQTLELNPLEGLTPQETSTQQDYFTKMQANLVNLKTALQCQ